MQHLFAGTGYFRLNFQRFLVSSLCSPPLREGLREGADTHIPEQQLVIKPMGT